jgi:hypothetical protein
MYYTVHRWDTVTNSCGVCGLSSESLLAAGVGMSVFTCPDYRMFSCCGGSGAATWDQTNNRWRCSDCGATQSTDADYLGGGFTPKEDADKWWKSTPKPCTCGSDKTYGIGATHTSWCDKEKK